MGMLKLDWHKKGRIIPQTIGQSVAACYAYLNCFGMQFLLLLNYLLLQTADLLFEVFNLTRLLTV